ncbi:class A beta-lactamase-related serine hydrolase [Hymenobacter weizhouensis]|uniref:class A beta-lactamase-related serine hydrolase n=1 Tax=Hymenobacter sp. YIM 151500-1 TaxID=2987689 RepID=UPI002227978B|nr:class A beta-lactamase-related serine hydrolase [Hymenobacter sp. YIM 151500-1]UYZ61722.1 class A beta-lactamase-related serine hydrolase [Hymenobacter sp. YIM 151500-1]
MRRLLLWWPILALLPSAAPQFRFPASAVAPAQAKNSPLLDSLLRADARLLPVVQRAAEYELQIIYTQINRDQQRQPRFVTHTFRVDERQYFNPASLVKLPTAILAFEKLNTLRQPGLTRRSPMATGAVFRCQTPAPYITSPDSDRINTVGNYVKRMLLVSDNQAYNRLYEFLGQRPLNERLAQLGYPTARIVRRFAPCDTVANRHTNPIEFRDPVTQQVCYRQPAAFNPRPFSFPLGRVTKGHAHQAGGRIIPRPYDFTTANYLPLQHCTDLLKAIIFPEAVVPTQRFHLFPNDYTFLRQYLQQTPHASQYSLYTSARYFDTYKKYLYYGRQPTSRLNSSLYIYNVVGMSHGYLADVAYFTDSTQHVEFMLSAVLYVNKDGIINDGSYEYESVGLPFLATLGQAIYSYEVKRPRASTPAISDTFTPKPTQ